MELQPDKIRVNVLSPQGRIKTPGNIFAGKVLRLETTNKPTKAGTPFTLHVWKVPG